MRLPGQYYDVETGLHYNYFRYYDPSLGRYVTADPLGLDAGPSLYTYVINNPFIFSDPLGLQCIYLYDDTRKAPYLLSESEDYYGAQLRSPVLEPLVTGAFPELGRRGRPGVPIEPSFRIKGYNVNFVGLKILTHIQQAQQDKRSCYLCDDPSEVVESIECTPSSTITCTEWERSKLGEPEVSRDIEFINRFIEYVPL